MSVIKTATGWRELGSSMTHPLEASHGNNAPTPISYKARDERPLTNRYSRLVESIQLKEVIIDTRSLMIAIATRVGIGVERLSNGRVRFGKYLPWEM